MPHYFSLCFFLQQNYSHHGYPLNFFKLLLSLFRESTSGVVRSFAVWLDSLLIITGINCKLLSVAKVSLKCLLLFWKIDSLCDYVTKNPLWTFCDFLKGSKNTKFRLSSTILSKLSREEASCTFCVIANELCHIGKGKK